MSPFLALKVLHILAAVAALIILLLARKLIKDSRTFEIPQDRDEVPSPSPKPILGVALLYVTNPTLYMYWIFVAGTVIEAGVPQARVTTQLLVAV